MFTMASITEPLCETTATRPGQDVFGERADVHRRRAPGATTPMQFGPATAMPSRGRRGDLGLRDVAASPLSENPPPGTTAARTPRAPASRSTSGTRSIRSAATTASGVSGSASSDG